LRIDEVAFSELVTSRVRQAAENINDLLSEFQGTCREYCHLEHAFHPLGPLIDCPCRLQSEAAQKRGARGTPNGEFY
jgi:hypothetical protein